MLEFKYDTQLLIEVNILQKILRAIVYWQLVMKN